MKNIRRALFALFVMLAFIVTPVYAAETRNNDIQNGNENQDQIPRKPPQHDVGRGNSAEETQNDVYIGPRDDTRDDRWDEEEEEEGRSHQDGGEEDTGTEQPGQERRY